MASPETATRPLRSEAAAPVGVGSGGDSTGGSVISGHCGRDQDGEYNGGVGGEVDVEYGT